MENISADELRKLFPGASKSTFKVNQAGSPIQSSKPKCPIQHEPLGPAPGTKKSPLRVIVRITGYRQKLLDPDNFCGGCKYLIDGLRYANLLSDDTHKHILLETTQEQVNNKDQERTEIVIERLA